MNKIAFNPAKNPNRGHACTATLDEYDLLIRQPWLHTLVEQIRTTTDDETCKKLKQQLPFRCAHYWHFKNDHRAQDALDSEAFLFQTTVDIDDAAVVEQSREKALALNDDHSSPWHGLLLHMEYSARHKLHIDLRMPVGLTIEETQRQYCEALGVPFDEDCLSPERMIYITDAGSEIFRSPEWYAVLSDEELARRRKALTGRGLPIDGPRQKTVRQKASAGTAAAAVEVPVQLPPYNPLAEDGGLRYEDITQAWLRQNPKTRHLLEERDGRVLPRENHRNSVLLKLACELRTICGDSQEKVLEVLPRCGLPDREMMDIVTNAFKYDPVPNPFIDRVVRELKERLSTIEKGADCPEGEEGDAGQQSSSLVPILSRLSSKKLPSAIRGSLAGVPESLYFPVMAAVLPIAGALADQVEVEYCDGQRQRLSLMSIILGNQASGKSVCKQVTDLWKLPLEREDADARKTEDEWKEKKKHRKANERCPEDPKVMIRVLPVTVSCSTLLRRLKNSRGHTLYSFGEELDTLRKTNGAGSWSSKYDIYRLGFDHGEWGQDYNSDQAESGTVLVAYNWTMLGTYGALRRCFSKDNVENGLSSRVLVAEMPDNSFAPMPKYGKRTPAHEAAILEGVKRLRNACGFIDTPRLRKSIGEWVEQKRVEAMADIDRVKDTYRKRAAVIGFRAGVICHLLSGDDRETKATLQFATAIAEMTLRGQMSVFGDALAKQLDEDSTTTRTGCNTGVFDRLPEVFTMGDIRQLKQGECNEVSLRSITSRWGKAGWTEKLDNSHWKKLKKA